MAQASYGQSLMFGALHGVQFYRAIEICSDQIIAGLGGTLIGAAGQNPRVPLMTKIYRTSLTVSLALLAAIGLTTPAHASELDDLRATVQSMQKSMEQMQTKLN